MDFKRIAAILPMLFASLLFSAGAQDLSASSGDIQFSDESIVAVVDSAALSGFESVYARPDTVMVDPYRYKFHWRQLVLPGALVAVGGFGVGNGWFKHIKTDLNDDIAHMRGHCYFRADDWIQYAPVVAYVGLGAVGVKCKHGIVERLLAGATAYAALGIMVNITKRLVDEKRPDSSAKNSFPSGHTATVFMGAELVRLEYGWPIAVGAYTVAGAVAFLRLYNARHWLNDVLAGAGIGILSARIGYWMLPLYQKWFKLNKPRAPQVAALPFYSPVERGGGFAFNVVF